MVALRGYAVYKEFYLHILFVKSAVYFIYTGDVVKYVPYDPVFPFNS